MLQQEVGLVGSPGRRDMLQFQNAVSYSYTGDSVLTFSNVASCAKEECQLHQNRSANAIHYILWLLSS